MNIVDNPLVALLKSGNAADLSLEQWDVILRLGRRAGLLATLADVLGDYEGAGLPGRVVDHLQSAVRVADRHRLSVAYEVEEVARALQLTDAPIVLLKGAAYTLSDLPAGRGRLFSDVDIMVPKTKLAIAESRLQFRGGWIVKPLSAYDKRYYRQWMHELPPMRHKLRGSELDVHHAIVPETARSPISMELLWADIVPISGWSGLWRLSDADLVIHSAIHLFSDGEFNNALRDLVDIWRLLRCFCEAEGDWLSLIDRAVQLSAEVPLTLALYFCREILGLQIPSGIKAVGSVSIEPKNFGDRWLYWCCSRGLKPNHPLLCEQGDALATLSLFVRSHYLKMPFKLLVPHLLRKWLISPWEAERELQKKEERMTLDKFMAEKKAGN